MNKRIIAKAATATVPFFFAVITCSGQFLGTTPPATTPKGCVIIGNIIASEITTEDTISVCYDSTTGKPVGPANGGPPCPIGDTCAS